MKLARKITLAIAAAILLVMAAHTFFLLRRQVVLFDADLARSTMLKRALRASIEEVWRAYGDDVAERLVEKTIPQAAEGLAVHWLWLDAPAGDSHHVDLPQAQLDELRRGERVILFRDSKNGDRHRVTYVTAAIEGSRTAVIEFNEPVHEQRAFVEASRMEIELGTVLILLACAAAVYGLGTWYVGRPIERLRDSVRAIAAGDFDVSIDVRQNDEIGELAMEIRRMAISLAEARHGLAAETEKRMAALERLRHTDRLTTIGQLVSGVAHELGTPLSVIAGRAEMIVSGESAADRAVASARVIVDQATIMTGLIQQLLDFTRRRKPSFELVDVRAVCAHTVDTLTSLARRRGVTIAFAGGDARLVVSADEHQLQQVLANLIVNALQAMPKGGRVEIAVTAGQGAPPGDAERRRDVVCVSVADEGMGITREDLARLFEPFFTTKEPGEGTGLGLAVVQGIVRDHGGWIEVESEVGEGTRFSIFLPPAAQARAA